MILNTLRLTNYKQYGHLELEFREGLVGIIGKNGAGKSTIFEAILYCLFGRDEGNKNHIRSAFAEPKTTVELQLDFSIGEIGYRVKREFRGKALAVGAEFYKNDDLVAKGVTAVNEELVKVLHMERDAFKRSVFSGQKELSEISDSTGEARKRMVRRMLGLDKLDEVQMRVNSDLRDLNSQIVGQRQNQLSEEALEILKNTVADYEKALESNQGALQFEQQKLQDIQEKYQIEKAKFDQEEARFKQHNALGNELTQVEERLAGWITQQEILKKKEADLRQLQGKLAIERAEFSGYETEKKTLDAMEREHSRHINRVARLNKIKETREQLDASILKTRSWAPQLAGKASVDADLALKQKTVLDLEVSIKAKIAEHAENEKRIGGIQASIRERGQKLDNLRALGREGSCPTCLQPLLEGYELALAALEQEINALQANQLQALELEKKGILEAGRILREQQESERKLAEKLLQEQTKLAEITRQYLAEEQQQKHLESRLTADETILGEIGEVNFDETAYQTLRAKLAAQEPRYRDFLSQENYVARELPATLAALQTAGAGITEAENKISTLKAALSTLGYNEAAYNFARQAVADFNEAFQVQTGVFRTLEKTGLEIRGELSKATEKIRANDRIQAQISDKLEEIELLRRLAEMLGLFKTEILEKVSPGISREASDLFSRITKGKYEGIRVDENFDFAIADGGLFYPIERFSGGEVDLANFCLRIAITKAIMDLSGTGQRLEFLAFDEIFGSQDEERRMEMMMALNYLQEQFRQIYIISHIDSLKDFFPHLLEVQSAAEGSTAIWR